MPNHRQYTVEVPASTRSQKRSDTASLQKAFPNSPIYGELTDETVREQGQFLLVDGGDGSDGGHTFGEYSLDYEDAPDIETEVATGGGGLPGTPWAPNIASPSEGHDPTTIPAAGAEATANAKGAGSPFVGDGLASPQQTSKINGAQKLGALLKGSSKPSQ